MPYPYLLTEDAASDYEEAFAWYNKRSSVASDKLIIAFAESMKRICKDPFQFRNPYKNFRELAIRKFPFKIIYFVDESIKHVVVISLFHNKRNPKTKYR